MVEKDYIWEQIRTQQLEEDENSNQEEKEPHINIDFDKLSQAEINFIEYIASFKTIDNLLSSGETSKINELSEEILKNSYYSVFGFMAEDIIIAMALPSYSTKFKAEKDYEECKILAKDCFSQTTMIDQAEKCLKAFKRYSGFLSDEDYIKFEEIKSNTEQLIKIYEKLFELNPEIPKKLGRLFRLIKTVFRIISSIENEFSNKYTLYCHEPLLDEYIEFIDVKIAELR